MTAHYTSRHGTVSRSKEELFMSFTDLRNFTRLAPAHLQDSVTADFDSLSVSVQGFRIGIKVYERQPYTMIRLGSTESPVEFVAALHFDDSAVPGKTDFWIMLDANLNLMMKAMLGKKLQEALDKIVDGVVAVSEGRMPDMPEEFKGKF